MNKTDRERMDMKQYMFNRVAETNPSLAQHSDNFTPFELELKKAGEFCFDEAGLPSLDVISEGQYIQICDDKFSKKVTARRIVALIEWSVRLAEKLYKQDQTVESVDAVAEWLTRYCRNKLSDWTVAESQCKKKRGWMNRRKVMYAISFMVGLAMGMYHSFLTHADQSHAEFYGNLTIA